MFSSRPTTTSMPNFIAFFAFPHAFESWRAAPVRLKNQIRPERLHRDPFESSCWIHQLFRKQIALKLMVFVLDMSEIDGISVFFFCTKLLRHCQKWLHIRFGISLRFALVGRKFESFSLASRVFFLSHVGRYFIGLGFPRHSGCRVNKQLSLSLQNV